LCGPALARLARTLESQFLGKQETVRLMMLSVLAGEHIALIGPPGTAKSALVRTFARYIDSRYFEYLLTRFTEPNELFGPVDIPAFRQGTYRRRTEGMMPEAEVVFLDEIFKSNSAILNALLTLLNERKFNNGGSVVDVPLLRCSAPPTRCPPTRASRRSSTASSCACGASTSTPTTSTSSSSAASSSSSSARREAGHGPFVSTRDLRAAQGEIARRMQISDELMATYKSLVFQIRAEGVSLSDRRVVKLLKLMAASAYFDGRPAADISDLFILKHTWNTLEQAEILDGIVTPVLDGWFRRTPRRAARGDGGRPRRPPRGDAAHQGHPHLGRPRQRPAALRPHARARRDQGRAPVARPPTPRAAPWPRSTSSWSTSSARAAIGHPNIVQMLDAGTDDDGPYLVLELLEGETLCDLIDRRPLGFREALAVVAETLDACAPPTGWASCTATSSPKTSSSSAASAGSG
jgi:MoxR-like ATPase